MNKTLITFISIIASTAHLSAEFKKLREGVFLEDFEEGSLDDWEYELEADVEISELLDNKSLYIKTAGDSVSTLDEYDSVSIEVDMLGAGSLRIGGKYEVSLTSSRGGSLVVVERAGRKLTTLVNAQKPFKLSKPIRVKVVSAGSLLRVFLNDRVEFEKFDASAGMAAIDLVASESGTLFDNVKISTALSPEDGVAFRPEPGKALVVDAGSKAVLILQTANSTKSDVEIIVAVRNFSGEAVDSADAPGGTVVEFGVNIFFRIRTHPKQSIKVGTVALKAGTTRTTELNLGKLPEGLFMLDIAIKTAGQAATRQWPISVQRPVEENKLQMPAIPIGVYTKLMQFRKKTEPDWWKTYMHAIAYDLKKHHINAVIAAGVFEPVTIEIFNKYGIVVLERGDAHLDHPGVLGTLLGDEPKPEDAAKLATQYASLQKKTEKPVLTCMVGDDIGIGTGGALKYWQQIQPRVRLFRWYGIKKSFYGILNDAVYKGRLPFSSVLRIVQASSNTPYWVVLPSFGTTEHEAYFQNPTEAQVRGMIHLSLAHGAKGILLFSYQGFDKFVGLVNPINLKPVDEKFAGAGKAASKVARHAKLIQSLKRGGLDIRCPSPAVEAIPVSSGNRQYVYAVNKNTREKVGTHLMLWAPIWKWSKARDLFLDADLEVKKNDEGYLAVSLSFEPGEGKLIETDAVYVR